MREIEFRGISKETGKFVYGNLIGKDAIVGEIVDWDEEYFATEFWTKVIPETVGQYIGVKDNTGAKIYVGDRVDLGDRFVIIVWNEDAKQVDCEFLAYRFGHRIMKITEIKNMKSLEKFKVYGNIHESEDK